MNRRQTAVVCLLGLLLSLGSIRPVAATTPQSGISIGPFEESISISPNDTQKSFTLQLTNHTTTVQELDLSTQDFGSLNDTGGILLEGANTYSQKYGLTSWLSLDASSVVLKPNETHGVTVTIVNRQDLQPGGHYGAIVASVAGDSPKKGNHVVLNQQLTSLVLVNKEGGDHYNLKLTSISHNGNWLHLPDDVRLEFQNPGNVHVIPRGLVELKNSAGTIVAQGIINAQSAFVLPETLRQLDVPLTPTGQGVVVPGTYSVLVQYRYDGLNSYASKSVAVRFIDLKLYVTIAFLLLGFGTLIRYSRRRLRQDPSPPSENR